MIMGIAMIRHTYDMWPWTDRVYRWFLTTRIRMVSGRSDISCLELDALEATRRFYGLIYSNTLWFPPKNHSINFATIIPVTYQNKLVVESASRTWFSQTDHPACVRTAKCFTWLSQSTNTPFFAHFKCGFYQTKICWKSEGLVPLTCWHPELFHGQDANHEVSWLISTCRWCDETSIDDFHSYESPLIDSSSQLLKKKNSMWMGSSTAMPDFPKRDLYLIRNPTNLKSQMSLAS